ncbi:hypothetical protein [Sulfobacillus harzensis]|uniref:Uncharacterized protein n=1 Tax=Sulfobacillus harzensis TaxID=2729629 RepID=A0A7Y0L514_9FIRM|nr:hypothetical protein [Sulfobacillus harzensis]NMP23444.1 hypothetical protein [Sulfobacillus harzensis]
MKIGQPLAVTLALTTLIGLSGCGTRASDPPPRSVQPSLNPAAIRAAFQRDHLSPGIKLGYRNRLYKLVRPVSSAAVGDKLGTVLYHGTLGQGFVLYAEKGTAVSSAVIFQAETGQYFEGIAVKGQP